MYKFQSFFRRIFGFYFCVFYGQGFNQGSLGLLPYHKPIVTIGECCSQPQGHLSAFSHLRSCILPLLHQIRGQLSGRSWELTGVALERRGRWKKWGFWHVHSLLFFHLFWQLGSLCPCPVLKTRAQRWWTNTMRSTWMPYTSCLTSIRSSTVAPTPRSCFSCDWRDSPWEHLLWRESESPGKGRWRRLCACSARGHWALLSDHSTAPAHTPTGVVPEEFHPSSLQKGTSWGPSSLRPSLLNLKP